MSQWHFSVNGQQQGPMDHAQAQAFASQNPGAFCWRPGFANWQLASSTPELLGGPVAGAMPVAGGMRLPGMADEIDFVIRGEDKRAVLNQALGGQSDLPVARLLGAAKQQVTCFT